MSKLIFLSWAFPPMLYPRAMQVGRLARYLGKPVHIYCAGQEGPDHPAPMPPDISVTRIADSKFENMRERVFNKLCPSFLRRPDKHLWWVRRATSKILKHENLGPDDMLVTFSQPHSDHLAGLQIKKQTGVKWAAYFSDPFVDNPFDEHAKRKMIQNMERDIVHHADRLLFSSQETIDLVMRKYPPEYREKACVLEHSYAEEHAQIKTLKPKTDRILIRHLGNLYQERSPLPLLQVLEDINRETPELLEKVTFDFVGHVQMREELEEILKTLPEELITFQGSVPYERSLELMHEADLLLLIEAPFDNSPFLPSKLVEYIGASKPVIALTPEGTGARVTRETGGFVADIRNPESTKEIIIQVLKNHQDIPSSLPEEIVNRFSPYKIAQDLNRLLEEIK